MTNALEVEHLTVQFGTTEVIRELSFGVPRGTSLAIIGPNGAGKTVLFKALIGSIPYEGTIRWAEGTKLGYVPQKLDIERDLPLSGRDFLRAKAAISKVSRRDVAAALALVGLEPAILSAPIEIGIERDLPLSGRDFLRAKAAISKVSRRDVAAALALVGLEPAILSAPIGTMSGGQ